VAGRGGTRCGRRSVPGELLGDGAGCRRGRARCRRGAGRRARAAPAAWRRPRTARRPRRRSSRVGVVLATSTTAQRAHGHRVEDGQLGGIRARHAVPWTRQTEPVGSSWTRPSSTIRASSPPGLRGPQRPLVGGVRERLDAGDRGPPRGLDDGQRDRVGPRDRAEDPPDRAAAGHDQAQGAVAFPPGGEQVGHDLPQDRQAQLERLGGPAHPVEMGLQLVRSGHGAPGWPRRPHRRAGTPRRSAARWRRWPARCDRPPRRSVG
jgi:hypothetical protein